MSQTILLPTDFSICADNALTYAVELAQKIKCEKIILLHCYEISAAVLAQPMIQTSEQTLVSEYLHELELRKSELQSKLGIEIEILLEKGNLEKTILQLETEHDFDFIVVGITGKNSLEQKLIGSHSYSIMKKAQSPICVVPEKLTNSHSESRITISLDLSFFELTELTKLKDLIQKLSYEKCRLIYVGNRNNVNESKFEKIKEFFEENNSIEYETCIIEVDEQRISEVIKSDIERFSSQALILMEKHYHLLESIFHSSVIKSTTFRTNIPIFVLENKG